MRERTAIDFVREVASRPCAVRYGRGWKADSCLGLHDHAMAHPEGYGDPLLTKLRNAEDMCDPCNARLLLRSTGEDTRRGQ